MIFDFLRKIVLFSDLPDDELTQICRFSTEIPLYAGQVLFEEGARGDMAYILKEGQVEVVKNHNGRELLLNVLGPQEVIGELALLESTPRLATIRARTDSILIGIGHEQFEQLMSSSPAVTRLMLSTVTRRLHSTWQMLAQSEKLAQIGTLTAGIAHELNNPAAAVQRGAGQLQEIWAELQDLQLSLEALQLPQEGMVRLKSLVEDVRQRAQGMVELSALERSDRQEELEPWLESLGCDNPWDFAPALVDTGYSLPELKQLAAGFPAGHQMTVLDLLAKTFAAYSLLGEIGHGAERISEIIKALKTYVYLDQAPVQMVDLHAGLDNTLVIMRSKLRQGVEVIRDYHPGLLRIQAYGSELNQVWTNLIDNAIDAMQSGEMDGRQPQLTLRTRPVGEWVEVDVEDNGPGIPDGEVNHIFDPFFTTKPLGKGTGLGLSISHNIVRKHHGEIQVVSQPGCTRFRVRLPVSIDREKPA